MAPGSGGEDQQISNSFSPKIIKVHVSIFFKTACGELIENICVCVGPRYKTEKDLNNNAWAAFTFLSNYCVDPSTFCVAPPVSHNPVDILWFLLLQ